MLIPTKRPDLIPSAATVMIITNMMARPIEEVKVFMEFLMDFNSSFQFCNKLIKEHGIALSPGSSFGSNGEGHVRFSLIHDEEKTIEAIKRIKEFFDKP